MNTSQWDSVAKDFFDSSEKERMHSSVADNVLIAYPVFLDIIDSHFGNITGLQALDFGTGTGGFAEELTKKGFSVTGIDSSAEMIAIAKNNSNSSVTYINGGQDCIPKNARFDLIVSLMVFQFIEDAKGVMSLLYRHLNDNGLFIIAVHNRHYIEECLGRSYKFKKEERYQQLHIQFGTSATIPVFDRSATDYQFIFEHQLNMKPYARAEPPFSEEYIEKYARYSDEPTEVSKYLILGFKK